MPGEREYVSPLIACEDPACTPVPHFHKNPERPDPKYEAGRRTGKIKYARLPYQVFGSIVR